MLSIRDVRKTFGPVTALGGVSFDLQAGEFVSFLGPSGCGKTTLLRIVAGLEEPEGGEVWIGDERLVGGGTYVLPEHRGFGMVFQSYALWPHMTVFQNLAYPLEVLKRPKDEVRHRVADVLRSLGLSQHGERRPSQLSGGQQQRVALGRALITRPRVLLLDEPLSNVDARVRQEMRLEIRRVQQDTGIAAIYVTHDQSEALAMSDRIVVMNHGSIEQVGSPEHIYRQPDTAFVAEFMGASLLEARVTGGDASRTQLDVPSLGIPMELQVPRPRDDTALVSVHTEDIRVVPAGTPGAGMARALVTSYLGSRLEVELQCRDARRLIGVLEGAWRPEYDAEVGVLLASEQVRLLPPRGKSAVQNGTN